MERASTNRIRMLQRSCCGESFSAVLLVGGVDGRYTYGATATLSWLFLGKSGSSLSRQTMGNIEGSTADWGASEAHELMDETFVLVTKNRVIVFMDEGAGPVLEPFLSFWSSSDVGLVVVCGGEDQKVFEFKSAILECLNQGQVVAMPLPLGAEGSEVERWPLIASFALELEDVCNLGQTGFFTMRHPVVDFCPYMEHQLFSQVDAIVVHQCAEDVLGSFREHWSLTAKHLSRTKGEGGSLNEENCVDHLSILFDSSIISEMDIHHQPRALIGAVRSELISDNNSKPCLTQISDESLHVIVESSDARSGATLCRTMFLSTGRLDNDCQSTSPTEQLMRSYISLQSSFCNSFENGLFDFTGTSALSCSFEKKLSENGLHGELRLQVEFFDAHGRFVDDKAAFDTIFCYIRASLHGLKSDGVHIGAVAVGDTFIVSRSGDKSQVSLTSLTNGRVAPYCIAVTGNGEYEAKLYRDLTASMRNHQPVGGVSLGLLKESIAGEITVVLDTKAWSHVTGQLKLYERGFSITNTGFAPFVVSFEHHLRGARVDDHPAGSMLLLAFNGVSDKLKPEHVLPLVTDLQYAALVLPSSSRHLSSIMHMLSEWRLFAIRSDVSLTQDFEIPSALSQLAQDSCVDCFSSFKSNLFHKCVDAQATSVLMVDQSSSSTVIDSSINVSVIMGLHGSGVLDVYSSLLNFCPDDVSLKSLLEFPSSAQHIQDVITKLKAMVGLKSSDSRERVVLVLVTDMSPIYVAAVMETLASVTISSITTCINAGTAKERMCESQYRRFRHGILELASDGFVSTMIALDSSSSKSNETDTEELRHAVRKINPTCLLARTNRGYLSSEAIHDILNKKPFQEPSMRRKRELHLCVGWQHMKLDKASLKTVKSFNIQLGAEVSALRLQIILAKVFPRATVRFPPQTVIQPQPSPSGHSFGVKRLWEIAQSKKCGEQAHEARVKEIEAVALGSLEGISVHGEVMVSGDKSIAIEGSASSLSVVLLKGNTDSSYLTFVSNESLTDSLCENLREVVLLAVGTVLPCYIPVRTRESLSRLEVELVIKNQRTRTPLPEGWLYDGNNYVNFDGRRVSERPDKETLLSDYITEENTKLSFWSSSK